MHRYGPFGPGSADSVFYSKYTREALIHNNPFLITSTNVLIDIHQISTTVARSPILEEFGSKLRYSVLTFGGATKWARPPNTVMN